MPWTKYYEDIVEARRENGAAVVFDYQHPQENRRRVAPSPAATARPAFTLAERRSLRIFVIKLFGDPNRSGRELLSDTANWSPVHFDELGKMSPEALACLAMAYRDELKHAA